MIPKKLHYLYIAQNEHSGPINPNQQAYCYQVGEFDCSIFSLKYSIQNIYGVFNIQWLVERSIQEHKEQGWEIFFWTNDKALIPHTVHFMESLGVPTLEMGQYVKNITRLCF